MGFTLPFFSSVDVVAIGCGSEHVVVVGGQGDVYAWGRGSQGRLGLATEDDACSPKGKGCRNKSCFLVVRPLKT